MIFILELQAVLRRGSLIKGAVIRSLWAIISIVCLLEWFLCFLILEECLILFEVVILLETNFLLIEGFDLSHILILNILLLLLGLLQVILKGFILTD